MPIVKRRMAIEKTDTMIVCVLHCQKMSFFDRVVGLHWLPGESPTAIAFWRARIIGSFTKDIHGMLLGHCLQEVFSLIFQVFIYEVFQ